MPGNGNVALPGFVAVTPGSGVIMIMPGLGLPPGIDDRRLAAADVLVVPEPRLGVDRLADRAQDPERRQVVVAGTASPAS